MVKYMLFTVTITLQSPFRVYVPRKVVNIRVAVVRVGKLTVQKYVRMLVQTGSKGVNAL